MCSRNHRRGMCPSVSVILGPPRLIFARNLHITKPDFVIVGVFILTWIIALSIWRLGKIEQRCDLAAAKANALDQPPG